MDHSLYRFSNDTALNDISGSLMNHSSFHQQHQQQQQQNNNNNNNNIYAVQQPQTFDLNSHHLGSHHLGSHRQLHNNSNSSLNSSYLLGDSLSTKSPSSLSMNNDFSPLSLSFNSMTGVNNNNTINNPNLFQLMKLQQPQQPQQQQQQQHFSNPLDSQSLFNDKPRSQSFSQFPNWVSNSSSLGDSLRSVSPSDISYSMFGSAPETHLVNPPFSFNNSNNKTTNNNPSFLPPQQFQQHSGFATFDQHKHSQEMENQIYQMKLNNNNSLGNSPATVAVNNAFGINLNPAGTSPSSYPFNQNNTIFGSFDMPILSPGGSDLSGLPYSHSAPRSHPQANSIGGSLSSSPLTSSGNNTGFTSFSFPSTNSSILGNMVNQSTSPPPNTHNNSTTLLSPNAIYTNQKSATGGYTSKIRQIDSYVLKETPTRTLFVANVNPIVEDIILISLFSKYGAVKSLTGKSKLRGYIIVEYYDIRHSITAMRHLNGSEVQKKKLDISYSVQKDFYCDLGTLVVFNLEPSVTNQTLHKIFGAYGQIKEIRETPNKSFHKFIEYYDIRDAHEAIKNLNKIEVAGKRLRIQHSRPGGTKKNLPSTDPYSVDLDTLFDQTQKSTGIPTISTSGSGGSAPSTLMSSNNSTNNNNNSNNNNNINLNSNNNNLSNLTPTKTQTPPTLSGVNLSLPTGWKTKVNQHFNNNTDGITASLSELQMNTVSPPSSPRVASIQQQYKNSKSPRSFGDKSPRGNGGSTPNLDQYILSIEKVKLGLDTRTSLMIKNLPNRLSQTGLLGVIDEHFHGTYDFLYVPIDPHSKVSYGYAFINFTSYDTIVPFYSEFNSRKWEKFYCSKVCEITYARIQGKTNLLQHLKPSLNCNQEEKKLPPVVFVSDNDTGICGEVIFQ